MKKIMLLVVSLLLATTLTLAGCSSNGSGLKNNPIITEAVINNGGISVQKGQYLYFTNGFASSAELKAGDNDWGDTSFGAIYRTKLNTDNSISYDSNGFLTSVERVVPKLVGYENGSFYIYGDYIYYSTPNNNKDRNGNSLVKLTDYFRVKINGTENTKLFTSETESLTAADWTIMVTGGNHYLVVKDGSKLVSVKANGKVSDKVVMATDVASAAFATYDTFYNNERATVEKFNNYVYYTRSTRESDNLPASISGNYLARVKVNTSTEEIVFTANAETYTMVAVKNNSIYYNMSTSTSLQSKLLYKNEIVNGTINASNRVQLTFLEYDKVFVLDSDTSNIGNYVLAYGNSTLYLLNGTANPRPVYNKDISILKVKGDSVLFSDAGALKRIANVKNMNATVETFNLNGKTLKLDSDSFIDYDGRNIFAFATYTSDGGSDNQYLNRIDTNTTEQEARFVGKFQDDHVPTEPDNSKLEPEDWVKWII